MAVRNREQDGGGGPPAAPAASPPDNLMLGIQRVALSWGKGLMAYWEITGLRNSREDYFFLHQVHRLPVLFFSLFLSCTFKKYQRNGTWHVFHCEAELSVGVPYACGRPPASSWTWMRLLGEWTPGETSRIQHTPLWAPQIHKQGLKRSRDVDGEGRSYEKWPRPGQDIVVMRGVLAETGRGSAQGMVGSIQAPGAGVGS